MMTDARIYLDHNGSTPVTPDVSRELHAFLEGYWGNAGAGHPDGLAARAAIQSARERVAAAIGGNDGRVVFTSGGTESNNMALFGAAEYQRVNRGRKHIVLGRHEHLSVVKCGEALAERGFDVTWIEPSATGAVLPATVEAAVRPDTALVALMFANNETGILQPVREAARCAHDVGALMFVDAVCGAGKVAIDVAAIDCDMMSLSGHKLHAPKGIGALWMREGVGVSPLILGCGQQDGLRSGTENTLGAVAFGAAMERHAGPAAVPGAELRALRDELLGGLQSMGLGIVRNGSGPDLPNTFSAWIPGQSALDLQVRLGAAGLSVSAQASRPQAGHGPAARALASGAHSPSHVLRAMGLSEARSTESLRFSLGSTTSAPEIQQALGILESTLSRTHEPSPPQPAPAPEIR